MDSKYQIAPALLILQEACRQYGKDIEFIGEKEGYLAKVSEGKKSFYAGGALTPIYPLNSATSYELCKDKFYSYEILSRYNIRVPKSRVFFPNISSNNQYGMQASGIPDALEYVRKHHEYPVIVKPNRGSMGRGVKLVRNDTDLTIAMNESLQYGHACLVQERISGEEHRIFCINGKARYIYKKVKPTLVGDGETSLLDLLRNNKTIDLGKISIETVIENAQNQLPYDSSNSEDKDILSRVLAKDETLELSNIGNITKGSAITDFNINIPEDMVMLGEKVSNALHLGICGIDLFVKKNGEAVILEVNANPSLLGIWRLGEKQFVMEIWQDIFKAYFD